MCTWADVVKSCEVGSYWVETAMVHSGIDPHKVQFTDADIKKVRAWLKNKVPDRVYDSHGEEIK